MNETEFKAYLQRLYDDFPAFYVELCKHVGLNPPCRMRLDIAHWIQHGPKRRGTLAKRKIGKSNIMCAYDCWCWFRNANTQVLSVSGSGDLAKDILTLNRRWLSSVPFLRHLAPNKGSRQARERDNTVEFDVGAANLNLLLSASMTAKGITSQLPGTGAHVVQPDDIEQPENTLTRAARELLLKRVDEFEHICLPDGDIVYSGTPHHEESVYRKLIERGYQFRAWPGLYPNSTENIPGLAPLIIEDLEQGRAKPGDPVFPDIFSQEEVALLQLRTSKSSFAMQVMLRTDLLETEIRPLRLDDLIVLDSMHRDLAPVQIVWGHKTSQGSTLLADIPSVGLGLDAFYAPILISPDWKPYNGTKAWLDPAGRGADKTAWAIASQLHGNIFVKYVESVSGGPTIENLGIIVQSLRKHGAQELWIETNAGGEYWIPLMEPIIRKFMVQRGDESSPYPNGWSCAILGEHSVGQKEKRAINRLSAPMQTHRVIVSPQVAQNRELAYQITRITEERGALEHDDEIDAFSGVVSRFTEDMVQDQDLILKRKNDDEVKRRLEKSLSRWHPKPEPPMWARLP